MSTVASKKLLEKRKRLRWQKQNLKFKLLPGNRRQHPKNDPEVAA
jgi:hypothetical protein